MPESDGDCQRGKQRKQARAAVALALAAGRTVEESADAGNVSVRTCYRWLRQPSFNRRVGDYRQQMLRGATGRLADTLGEATAALRQLLASETETVRLRAADLILAHSVRLDESVNLRAKVAELETLVRGRGEPSWTG